MIVDKQRVRTRKPFRMQRLFYFETLEETIAADPRARLLWRVVETLDLSDFLAGRRALEGQAGRAVISVRMLLTLWLYATSVGVGSAREIARRLKSDDGFRWIAGGVPVGRTVLGDFRTRHRQALDRLLSQVLGVLMHKGLLSLELVAQGARLRAPRRRGDRDGARDGRRGEEGAARVDDRPRGARDEDGRRRLPTRVQRAARDRRLARRRTSNDRRRAGHEQGLGR
jgi:transposase